MPLNTEATMTRARIAELLTLVVLEMGNHLPAPHDPAIGEAEWAYVKGIAAGEVLRLRNRLQDVR